MFKTNELIRVIHPQKIAHCDRNCQQFFQKIKKICGCLINLETFSFKEVEIWAVKNIFPLVFIKYLSYSEVQRAKLLMFRSDPFKFVLQKRSIGTGFW